MNTYLYREKKIKNLFSKKKKPHPEPGWKKKSFDATKSPAPFSKLDKIPRFTGSDVTMARIIRTAEPTSWPLPPGLGQEGVINLGLGANADIGVEKIRGVRPSWRHTKAGPGILNGNIFWEAICLPKAQYFK